MANCLSEVSFRKSPRIEGYDYGSVNYYFVTICTYEKIWNYIDTNPLRWREDCFFIQA